MSNRSHSVHSDGADDVDPVAPDPATGPGRRAAALLTSGGIRSRHRRCGDQSLQSRQNHPLPPLQQLVTAARGHLRTAASPSRITATPPKGLLREQLIELLTRQAGPLRRAPLHRHHAGLARARPHHRVINTPPRPCAPASSSNTDGPSTPFCSTPQHEPNSTTSTRNQRCANSSARWHSRE